MPRENWTYKDIENFYDRVRLALNSASATDVPNEYIDFPEKAPFAESIAKIRVPTWESLSDTQFSLFESIVVYQTAVSFQSLVSSKFVKKKQIPTITLEYSESVGYGINNLSLSDIIDYLVAELNGENSGSDFIGFRVTKGGKH